MGSSGQTRPDLHECRVRKTGKSRQPGRAAGVRHPDIRPRIKCPAPVPSAWIASWMAAMSKTPGRRAFGRAEEERGCRWRRSRLLGCLAARMPRPSGAGQSHGGATGAVLDDDFPCACGIGAVSVSQVSAGDLGWHSAGDMRLAMRERERKKKRVRLLRLDGSIRAQRRMEARRGNRQKMRAMQGEKGGRVGFPCPRFGGIAENAKLEMGLCGKCHHQPSRPLLQQRGGAGGVGMPLPNWSRQLWRHQCRSHFPANPDGAVRGLTPEIHAASGRGRGEWN